MAKGKLRARGKAAEAAKAADEPPPLPRRKSNLGSVTMAADVAADELSEMSGHVSTPAGAGSRTPKRRSDAAELLAALSRHERPSTFSWLKLATFLLWVTAICAVIIGCVAFITPRIPMIIEQGHRLAAPLKGRREDPMSVNVKPQAYKQRHIEHRAYLEMLAEQQHALDAHKIPAPKRPAHHKKKAAAAAAAASATTV